MSKPMQDIDTKTAAERWNVKPGTVAKYCKDGLVPGALKVNNAWKIPSDSIKPLTQDEISKILRLVNTLKHYPDIAVDNDVVGLADKNVLRIFEYLVAVGMIQKFDVEIPTELLPYKLSLTQRGLELITQTEKKKVNMDISAKDIVSTGISAIGLILQFVKVA